MLERSFVHIPGIGVTRERKLWQRGVLNWDHLVQAAPELFKGPKAEAVLRALEDSREAYARNDLYYFYRSLPRDHLWRLVPGALEKAAYLDIETTGLGYPPACQSTTVTFYFRGQVYQEYEHREKKLLIEKILAESSMLVTFFGESFDVPFLSREYGIRFDKAHLDLCFWLKRLGYRGGLKKIQKQFPEIPQRTSLDIDGFDAVRLWRMHESGIVGALETLLAYNAEDTIVLEPLLVRAFNLELERNLALGLEKISCGVFPKLPTQVREDIYIMLR